MRAVQITLKSTLCREVYPEGIEYRVLFENIPAYLIAHWKTLAEGIVMDEELKNPKLEMQAVLLPNDTLENVQFQYYFDGYEFFELTEEDEKQMRKLFIEYIKRMDDNLPDAYNAETGEILGDCEWEALAGLKTKTSY